jgi:hypothetical protein
MSTTTLTSVAAVLAAAAHRDRCEAITTREQLDTLEQKQQYAECVQYIYPVRTPEQEKAMKQCAVMGVLAFILLTVVLSKTVYENTGVGWRLAIFSSVIIAIFSSVIIFVFGSAVIVFIGWILS